MSKYLKSFTLILMQIFICSLVLEVTSCYYLRNSSNALYRARKVLIPDRELGWRLRSGLDTHFEGARLITDKNGFRVSSDMDAYRFPDAELLTLGPSSAFGWGVENNETYTARVADEMKLIPLNASQIGFTVIQGEVLWHRNLIDKFKNLRYAIIAYGVNELDKFRFYSSNFNDDLTYFEKYPLQQKESTFLEGSSDSATLYSIFIDEFNLRRNCSALSQIRRRVEIEEYLNSVDRLVRQLESRSASVILVNTAYFLGQEKRPEFNSVEMDRQYKLTQEAAERGKCDEALAHLQIAKSMEPQRVLNDVKNLNEALGHYAVKMNLPLVDAYSILTSPQEEAHLNFVDPVHPSARGHELISRQIKLHMVK